MAATPMAAVEVGYASFPADLCCHETAGGMRAYVPFRRRERS